MADTFHSTAGLRSALADASFDRPPALVANAHITGLGVARALAAHGVPVVALDRTGRGVASPSDAVAHAGQVTYPLDDPDAFREDVEGITAEIGHEPVAFACMDEWVNAFAGTDPDGVRLPFADDGYDAVLDKESLYRRCADLGVPYPETYSLAEVDPAEAADRLGFPLVLKPARKREGEAVLGTNVVEATDREEFDSVVATAEDADLRLLAQERVDVAPGEDRSVVSYVPPSGSPDALGVVGNPRVRYPTGFGTSCVVERVENPGLTERAYGLLDDAGYHGISEAEFVYDEAREAFVLLDVNTRPWKWIGLPVEAGADLPVAAYAETVDAPDEPALADGGEITDATWVYLRDYLAVLASEPSFADVLDRGTWTGLASGRFETERGLTAGVYAPSDPAPTARLLETEFGSAEYYCSC